MKLNNPDNYDPIMVTLDPTKHPIAFEQRVQSWVNSGLSREDAEREASTPIDLELYYDANCGLFAVESEVVDNFCDIYNPYDGTVLERPEEE